ncbi:hypothetical protein DXC37_10070 [Bifidobacterium bifidum]|nr:hypothetical protein DXC37_10070 [Bifidobacterium bifidum]
MKSVKLDEEAAGLAIRLKFPAGISNHSNVRRSQPILFPNGMKRNLIIFLFVICSELRLIYDWRITKYWAIDSIQVSRWRPYKFCGSIIVCQAIAE